MNLMYGKGMLIIIFIGFASTAYHYLSSKKKKRPSPGNARKKQINDVLMFSQATQSELVRSKYSRSVVQVSTDRLLSYLSLTRHTLDICMYMITNHDIAHLIQKLHNRGVRIRFIVDADMAYSTGSATKRIERQGIELRWMKSTNYMHHKFCLIDASAVNGERGITPFAMIGSLNWTNQGLSGNWENVLVASKPEIVQGLKEEFEKLWFKFKPIVK